MDRTEISFEQAVRVGCGIDVHQAVIVATIQQRARELRDKRVLSLHKFFDRFKRMVQK